MFSMGWNMQQQKWSGKRFGSYSILFSKTKLSPNVGYSQCVQVFLNHVYVDNSLINHFTNHVHHVGQPWQFLRNILGVAWGTSLGQCCVGIDIFKLNCNHGMLWKVLRGSLIWSRTVQSIDCYSCNKIPDKRAIIVFPLGITWTDIPPPKLLSYVISLLLHILIAI